MANNVNQIAHRVNATSRIYKQELYELQEGVTEIWQQLQSIQSELQKLNPSSMETKRICKEKHSCTGSQLKLLYPDGIFPSETMLDRQRQALYEEREKLYEEYRYLKKRVC